MANYNRVILMGNLTRDPQLSFLPSNTPVCEFGLAINRRWRGQDGNMQDETCFVDCSIYGRQAETFNQYMSKGRPVHVEGRLRLSQWESQDGQKRSKLSVVVERFQFVSQGGRSEAPQGSGYGSGRSEPGGPPPESAPPAREDDDIPF
jgi:single-strand DNA-binding protein